MSGLPLGERQLNTLDAQLQGQRSGKAGILLPSNKPNNAAQQQPQPLRSAGAAAKTATGSSAAAILPADHMEEGELSQMLDLCLRLAAENRITDKNVWALPLIDHLPDIVQTAAKGAAVNFGKMSSGLDAGVQIYSKRVEQTWKAAHNSLFGIDKKDSGKDGEEGGGEDAEDEEGEDGEGGAASSQQREVKAAAAAARRAKAHAAEGQATDTLEAPEKLAMKALDTTFQIDPLFHHMSAKFDQGGAAGLLQLHCRVYGGAVLLTEPHAAPEACFCGSPQEDQLVEVGATAGRLRALVAQAAAGALDTRVTPDIYQLAGMLGVPMGEGVEGAAKALVKGVADEVFGGGKAYPHVAQATTAAAAAAAAGDGGDGSSAHAPGAGLLGLQDEDSPMEDAAYSSSSPGPASSLQQEEGQGAAAAAAGGEEADPVLAAFAAACVTQEDLEEVSGAGRSAGELMGGDYEDGYDGDGGGGWGEEEGGEAGAEGAHVARSAAGGLLRVAPAEAGGGGTQVAVSMDPLAWLRNLEGSSTSSSGWLVGGGWKRGGAKNIRAAAKRPRVAKQQEARLEFSNPPPLPEAAFATGTKQQTCLAGSSAAAATLRPNLSCYEASSFAHLFCNPGATSAAYSSAANYALGAGVSSRPGPYSTPGKREYTSELDMEAAADVADGDVGAGWGGWDDGGGGDDEGDGWEGGDGNCTGAATAGGGMAPWQMPAPAADAQKRRRSSMGVGGWEEEEGGGGYQLLRVAHKVEAVGLNYSRSAKQVDVRALKDVIWDKLNTVADVQQRQVEQEEEEEMVEGGMIHFQQVLQEVPAASAAGPLEELSVHMCFICLLHLANEKGLAIASTSDLAGLKIRGGWR